MKMLILRGISGWFDGRNWKKGALHEEFALAYAQRRGYDGEVLDISGEAYPGAPQAELALKTYRRDKTIGALYGFSGGGYNLHPVVHSLHKAERSRLELLVILGAPKTPEQSYKGPWELVYRRDPPGGHMDGPRALLAEWDAARP